MEQLMQARGWRGFLLSAAVATAAILLPLAFMVVLWTLADWIAG